MASTSWLCDKVFPFSRCPPHKAEDGGGAAKGGSWPGSRVLRAEALPGAPLQSPGQPRAGLYDATNRSAQPPVPPAPLMPHPSGGGSPRGGPGPRCPLLPSQHWSPLRPTDPVLPSSGKEGGLAGRRDWGGGRPPERRWPGPVAPECGGQRLGAMEFGAQEGALGSARMVRGSVVTPETQSPQQ